jgi:hypothetical protein
MGADRYDAGGKMIFGNTGERPGRKYEKWPSKCEHGAKHDAVKTVHPAEHVSQINGARSQGGKRASAADKFCPAKHAEENPPSCVSIPK